MPENTLIIGLGNPLCGDDGVGVRVVEELTERILPYNVQVIDGGTPGLNLINLMEDRQRVILVDAADIGQAPGQFARFTFDEIRLPGNDPQLSAHAVGLRDALLLAHALNKLPPEIIIFGIQPHRLEWETGLSPQVEASLPGLVAAVLVEARSRIVNSNE